MGTCRRERKDRWNDWPAVRIRATVLAGDSLPGRDSVGTGDPYRFGIVRFGSIANTLLDFNQSESLYPTSTGLNTFIDTIAYTGGGTCISCALLNGLELFNTQSHEDATKLILLITDGQNPIPKLIPVLNELASTQ